MWTSRVTSPNQSLWNSLSNGKSETKAYTEVIFKFQVDVTFSNLSAPPYSVYQQFLYDKIMELREEGLNFKRIADWLNENNH